MPTRILLDAGGGGRRGILELEGILNVTQEGPEAAVALEEEEASGGVEATSLATVVVVCWTESG